MPPTNPKYNYVRDLGKGAFGSVILAQDTATDHYVAVKKLSRMVAGDIHIERELLLHSSLRHPHIVRFHQVFLSPRNCNIVMEYVPDGSLLHHVQHAKRLPEAQARWLFQQLILAVDYCHQLGICNRDIKLDNILLDKSDKGKPDWPILKLCDWGYAKAEATSVACSKVGTLSYMAPEILRASGSYSGQRADIWNCGVVLYAMLVGSMPFANLAHDGEPANLAEGVIRLLSDMQSQRFILPRGLSREAQDLLRQMLQPDPVLRISIAGILQHPWFMAGLPSSALSMNEIYLKMPRACTQTEGEIWAIVRRVRHMATEQAAAAVAEVGTVCRVFG